MRASAKLFYAIAVFLGISGVVYVFGTVWIEDDGWKYRYGWWHPVALVVSYGDYARCLPAYNRIPIRRPSGGLGGSGNL